jgi:hypothetical protein
MADYSTSTADVVSRFRRETDWFVVWKHGEYFGSLVGANSERVVDLLPALANHLDPAVDVFIENLRDRREWQGALLALPDVREVVGRLRLPLAMHGGVEVTIVTPDDQLTLTPELQIVIYARTDRWYFLLQGMGLVEREAPPPPVWMPSRAALQPVADLTAVLDAAAERLGLDSGPRA